MKIKLIIFLSIVLICFQHSHAKDERLEIITEWFSGQFSTSEQAAVDSQIIDLHLNVVPFTMQNDTSKWFYLETSFTSSKDEPYKQEVYHFYFSTLGLIMADRYSFKNPDTVLGSPQIQILLNNLPLDQFVKKDKCSIVMSKSKDIFIGLSPGNGCTSKVRNALYSKTNIEITNIDFFLWERGYNSSNKQVWGPTENGYVFKKVITEKP